MADIKRYRGDTVPLGISVTQDKRAYDLTDCVLVLTISSEEKPEDSTSVVQTNTAVLDTDPTTGKASFEFANTDFDYVGAYFYDIELTDPNGKKKTLAKSKVKMSQDITK